MAEEAEQHNAESPSPARGAEAAVPLFTREGTSAEASDIPDLPMLVRILSAMLRARIVDQRMQMLQRQGRISFHVGYLGEEAAIVAAAAALRDSDWIFPCYRELGALLWRGFPLQDYVDNMFGNAHDHVQGRQMPDHVTSRSLCYASVSSPIGTQLPHAVGLSWAAKLRGDDRVAAAFFGEGGTSSSDFHSAANFAGVYKTPTLFLCRNNGWAISTPASAQTASPHFASKASAYGIRGVRCDGNDAAQVFQVVRDAARHARHGGGPTLVELETYRQGAHSTSDDPSVYRSSEEAASWLERDPIRLLTMRLQQAEAWQVSDTERATRDVEQELSICIERAEVAAAPAIPTMIEDVYADPPWHLVEQLERLEHGPRAPRRH